MPITPRTFAILSAIQSEMQRQPNLVYSQQGSTGSGSRADGKNIDLLQEFGLDRALARFGQVIDEEWMASSAVTYAASGYTACTQLPAMTTMYPAEIMFNTAGKIRYMSGGQFTVPVVMYQGGSGRGIADAVHAEAGTEEVYAWMAGVKVVCPHKVYDCKGLMASALRANCAVEYLNYSTEASADIPDEPYLVPIGKAQILLTGTDLTIATWPPANVEVEKALPDLTKAGIKVDYFDVRTLKPFDEATLVASVKKTGRLLVVSHGHYTNGFSSFIIAVAAQEVPGAKFRMITFPDCPSPGVAELCNWLKPDAPKIVEAAQKMMKL